MSHATTTSPESSFKAPWRLGNTVVSREPLLVFSAGGPCEQFWHGQGCPVFDVVHPAFPLPTSVAHPPKCPEDGFGEAGVACDMPKPRKFLSLDSCQRRFLWIHKEVDLAPHLGIGLVLQEGDTEKFPHALGFESLDSFFQNQQAGSMIHSRGSRMEATRDLQSL